MFRERFNRRATRLWKGLVEIFQGIPITPPVRKFRAEYLETQGGSRNEEWLRTWKGLVDTFLYRRSARRSFAPSLSRKPASEGVLCVIMRASRV